MLLIETYYENYTQQLSTSYMYRYDVRIDVADNKAGGYAQRVRMWTGLKLQAVVRFDWYFRRVAAFIQINHPRKFVKLVVVRQEIDQRAGQIQTLTNRIKNAKAKVTQFTLTLQKAKDGWNQLFPIEDDHNYKKVQERLQRKKEDLAVLEKELEILKTL